MPLFPPLNPPITHWAGQRVWIIGASSGIGAETALLLAERGAWVALSARRSDALEALRARFAPGAGAAATVLPLDITDPAAVDRAAQTLLARWDGLDLVLIAAGMYDALRASSFNAAHLPVLRMVMDVNLMGTYHVLAATLPLLTRQGRGGIAIISSVAGYNGLPRALAYAPSKAALNNLCEGLYFELRPLGLAVYRICPGFIATAMTAGNNFTMPALLPAKAAASEIVNGMERGEFEIHFPKRFTYFLKVMSWLPRRLYFILLRMGSRQV
ncbi:MAG: SDR family NAD(P)-dependent oxidoreductase [Betaproteobacteria bacterium]|nr:SDR family NAD(P)-dependent oxidoreductase [Betaproteobacteria bacterium]